MSMQQLEGDWTLIPKNSAYVDAVVILGAVAGLVWLSIAGDARHYVPRHHTPQAIFVIAISGVVLLYAFFTEVVLRRWKFEVTTTTLVAMDIVFRKSIVVDKVSLELKWINRGTVAFVSDRGVWIASLSSFKEVKTTDLLRKNYVSRVILKERLLLLWRALLTVR